jgi:hypothetical protein
VNKKPSLLYIYAGVALSYAFLAGATLWAATVAGKAEGWTAVQIHAAVYGGVFSRTIIDMILKRNGVHGWNPLTFLSLLGGFYFFPFILDYVSVATLLYSVLISALASLLTAWLTQTNGTYKGLIIPATIGAFILTMSFIEMKNPILILGSFTITAVSMLLTAFLKSK